ncbi:membrane-spanning 4-domains subfamily A member 13 isoform X2 [Pan paniscus]|uniref:membrane-spanning 4-domains subfamily A member 13 isoform X2 n=1 Tax=Pan paniscus TaxID=9597 RepID=UPI0004F0980E|nr:membrane-spanning 4-domains subfamily A member 13 isoform X2 [Pan paniscus]XP_009458706.1 membrane-spanning 4-domains subfamily A member 13 isoform X2 [Pan troglodytes]XP_054950355.1 membrane-spanning 4-domains subfamily A member 13 isoform X2 [Pan paniscus]
MACVLLQISTADSLVLGTIQIMIGIFHVFMWYFLLVLYTGQIKGAFGTYEPVTYKTGCTLWGISIISTLIINIICIITTITAVTLTIIELSHFNSVSYRNYGQAKLGREVSRILLFFYALEFSIALTHSIYSCSNLFRRQNDLTSVTEEADSTP